MVSNRGLKYLKTGIILLFLIYTIVYNISYRDYYPLGIDYSASPIEIINWYIIIGLILVFNSGYYREQIKPNKWNYIIRSKNRKRYFIMVFLKYQFLGLIIPIIYIGASVYYSVIKGGIYQIDKETLALSTLIFICSIFTLQNIQINLETVFSSLISFLIINVGVFAAVSLPEIHNIFYKYLFVFNFLSYKRIDDLQLFFIVISILLLNSALFCIYLRRSKHIEIL